MAWAEDAACRLRRGFPSELRTGQLLRGRCSTANHEYDRRHSHRPTRPLRGSRRTGGIPGNPIVQLRFMEQTTSLIAVRCLPSDHVFCDCRLSTIVQSRIVCGLSATLTQSDNVRVARYSPGTRKI